MAISILFHDRLKLVLSHISVHGCSRLMASVCVIVMPFFGCDPVRSTVQTLVIEVKSRMDWLPAANTMIRVKIDWVSQYPSEKSDRLARKNWEQFPWHEGVTDPQGCATISMEIGALDWNRDHMAPESRSQINRQYLLGIVGENGAWETAKILLTPGATAETDSFSIHIIDVGPVSYTK